MLIMETSSQPASTLLFNSIDNSKIVNSGSKNNKKLVKSDFMKTAYRVEESSFVIPNTRQIFT